MLTTNPGWMFQTYDSWAIRGDTTLAAATDKLLAHVGGGRSLQLSPPHTQTHTHTKAS